MNEDQAVAPLQERNPGTLPELVATYGDRLLRSACLLCGDPVEAQDLVQETLLQAIRSSHRFEGRSGLYTWLHGILLNLTRHYHRRRHRVVYDEELAHRELPPTEESPLPLDLAFTAAALTGALRQLSEPHREVLVLRYYENMKIQELAAHLGVSPGTVKSRLHYALAAMQARLPGEMNLLGAPVTEKKESI
jgi:RNA polymerase sigma-70 factor (ECF subfamily)